MEALLASRLITCSFTFTGTGSLIADACVFSRSPLSVTKQQGQLLTPIY
jgi:hypothetical protein